jgi:ankyrin repeat protein
MEMLLEGGANANATDNYRSGLNLLTEAVNRGDAEAVRLLIEAGAEVNAPSRRGIGRTALCYAHDAHMDVTELLLAHGADVNLYSPLRWAVAGGHKETVALLLAHGADVNARDAAGETVLDEALARGKTEIVTSLREHAQTEQTKRP